MSEMQAARKKVLHTIDGMKDEIVQCCSDLVKIPSVDPLYPGIVQKDFLGGEKRCNEFLKSIMEEFGCETDMFEKEPYRTNLVGLLRGEGKGRSLILNGHIDTVPWGRSEDWMWNDPVSGKVFDGKIYGRGSCDMKSGIVAMIKAIEAIKKCGYDLKGDVILESVVGEEMESHHLGTSATVKKGYRADAAIVTEPSAPPISLAIVPVTSGFLYMTLDVIGKAVHCSMRRELVRAGGKGSQVGVNAVEKGVKMLLALQELETQWGISKTHPLFRPGHFTIHPGVVIGGPHGVLVPFIISEFCTIHYAVWYPPDETYESVTREIEDYVRSAAQLDPWLRDHPPKVEWKLHWPPSKTEVDDPICKTLASAHENATGLPAQYQGFCATCDATFLNEQGIPTVIYGPGDLSVAHGPNEYVPVDELIDATRTYALTALDWCGVK